jgi:hypothetical protein
MQERRDLHIVAEKRLLLQVSIAPLVPSISFHPSPSPLVHRSPLLSQQSQRIAACAPLIRALFRVAMKALVTLSVFFPEKGCRVCWLVGTHVHNPSVKSDRTCGRGRHMALLNVTKTSGALWMWRWQNGAITN